MVTGEQEKNCVTAVAEKRRTNHSQKQYATLAEKVKAIKCNLGKGIGIRM